MAAVAILWENILGYIARSLLPYVCKRLVLKFLEQGLGSETCMKLLLSFWDCFC